MDIDLKKITVRELVEGYEDKNEDGVFGYAGKLDIRPPFQREFIYDVEHRNAVIDTLTKDYPLNVMYWSVQKDGYEVIDGQQRTISICQFVEGDFAFKDRYFHNLQEDEKEQILNYELTVYFCSGDPSEKLEWFTTINIAGLKLEPQELLNATYSGSWVTDAKRYFSKTGCAAYGLGAKYLTGIPIRQKYLETVIRWISNDNIKNYMGVHQLDKDAKELWKYFTSIIEWIEKNFTVYRKEMQSVQWGALYNEFKTKKLSPIDLEEKIAVLMADEDVTSKKGIYDYVLTGKQRSLSIRVFDEKEKREAYERQKRICPHCTGVDKGKLWDLNEMEADHITPWHEGGKTISENCQMLCKTHNRLKAGK